MGLFDRFRRYNHNSTVGRANETYDVKIYEGELWLTFCGALVCPCSWLKDDAIEAVGKMRELYIKRHE